MQEYFERTNIYVSQQIANLYFRLDKAFNILEVTDYLETLDGLNDYYNDSEVIREETYNIYMDTLVHVSMVIGIEYNSEASLLERGNLFADIISLIFDMDIIENKILKLNIESAENDIEFIAKFINYAGITSMINVYHTLESISSDLIDHFRKMMINKSYDPDYSVEITELVRRDRLFNTKLIDYPKYIKDLIISSSRDDELLSKYLACMDDRNAKMYIIAYMLYHYKSKDLVKAFLSLDCNDNIRSKYMYAILVMYDD